MAMSRMAVCRPLHSASGAGVASGCSSVEAASLPGATSEVFCGALAALAASALTASALMASASALAAAAAFSALALALAARARRDARYLAAPIPPLVSRLYRPPPPAVRQEHGEELGVVLVE